MTKLEFTRLDNGNENIRCRPREFKYYDLISEPAVMFLIGHEMVEVEFENGSSYNFEGSVTLTLTSDDPGCHTAENISRTSTNVPNLIQIV